MSRLSGMFVVLQSNAFRRTRSHRFASVGHRYQTLVRSLLRLSRCSIRSGVRTDEEKNSFSQRQSNEKFSLDRRNLRNIESGQHVFHEQRSASICPRTRFDRSIDRRWKEIPLSVLRDCFLSDKQNHCDPTHPVTNCIMCQLRRLYHHVRSATGRENSSRKIRLGSRRSNEQRTFCPIATLVFNLDARESFSRFRRTRRSRITHGFVQHHPFAKLH